MVQTREWGPPLWRILHTLAERLGYQSTTLLQTDETRCWIRFLQKLERVLPCAMCRQHMRAWRTAHPLEAFLAVYTGPDLRVVARAWLWEFHSAVMDRTVGAEAPRPALEDMERIYGPEARTRAALQEDIDTLMRLLMQAVQERQIDGSILREWRTVLQFLRKLLAR